MQSALATLFPTEVFYGIGDIDVASLQPYLLKHFRQHLSRRTDEWFALQVFLVARDFPDKHQPRFRRSLAKHCLSCSFVELTAMAYLRRAFQLRQAPLPRRRQVIGG